MHAPKFFNHLRFIDDLLDFALRALLRGQPLVRRVHEEFIVAFVSYPNVLWILPFADRGKIGQYLSVHTLVILLYLRAEGGRPIQNGVIYFSLLC